MRYRRGGALGLRFVEAVASDLSLYRRFKRAEALHLVEKRPDKFGIHVFDRSEINSPRTEFKVHYLRSRIGQGPTANLATVKLYLHLQ